MGVRARRLLTRCLERDVAFVPGDCFFPAAGHDNTLRLNFSNSPEERIVQGIARLGEELRAILSAETEPSELVPAG